MECISLGNRGMDSTSVPHCIPRSPVNPIIRDDDAVRLVTRRQSNLACERLGNDLQRSDGAPPQSSESF
eukprot:399725-Hanusia_phi.AAC.1